MRNKAVFLDRDGTIIEEKNYLSDPNQVFLIEGVAEAIRMLTDAGFLTVMVSNQSGVARGMFTEEQVNLVNNRVRSLLHEKKAEINAMYYCPHYLGGSVPKYAVECQCRKPKPGLGNKAAQELGIDLKQSFMVGDKLSDLEFGKNCGMRHSFIVATGHGENIQISVDHGTKVDSIYQAAKIILSF